MIVAVVRTTLTKGGVQMCLVELLSVALVVQCCMATKRPCLDEDNDYMRYLSRPAYYLRSTSTSLWLFE
jgi:hypothetical protein